MGESQGGREPHLDERGGDQSGSMERKGWASLRRKAGSKDVREGKHGESLKGNRRKHERVSVRKSSPGRSAQSWFHFKSGQT